jgi:hypothetical protein
MKKIIIFIIILAVVIGGYFVLSQSRTETIINKPATEQKPGLKVLENNSLSDWLARNRTIECVITTDKGDIKALVKNRKIRIEGIPYAFNTASAAAQSGYSLTDGDWVYMWSGNKGTKMNLKEVEATMSTEQKAQASTYSWQDSVKSWEASGYKYNCQEKKLSDDLFVAPKNVEFSDITATLISAQQIGAKLKNSSGNGTVNPEDIEAEMEKLNQ